MNKQESSALNITRFVMSIGIVLYHSYTSVQLYPFLKELPIYQQVSYVISMQFGEVGVPTFFIISGYLFFYGYKQTWGCYKYKMEKRFYSLLIPYIFWNGLILGLYYMAECIPSIQELFNDGKKLVHDFGFSDYLGAFGINKGPIVDQLWFVRNLILLAVASPIIYFFVRYTKLVGVIGLGLLWFFGTGMAYPQSSIFYFSLGAYFSIHQRSLTQEMSKISILVFTIFPIIVIMDFLLNGTVYGYYIHRTQTFTGTLFIIALISMLLKKGKIHDIVFLSSSSFFLYVTHDPLLRFMRRFSLKLVDHNSEFQVITTYLVTVIINIAIVYTIYWILRKYAPWFLKWTTGR